MNQATLTIGGTRSRLICAIVYPCVFLLLAAVLHHRIGFPLDDSWIHQVIARNLAQTHRLGFIPGRLTTGSTSLLWSCLLALYWSLLPSVSPVVLSALTSLILLAGIGFSFKAITEEDGLSPGVSWCLALGPLASGNFLWLGMIGMEHLLFILLSILLLRQWMQPLQRRTSADLPLLAVYSFLLVLTRPEGLFLALLLLLTVRLAGRSLRALFSALTGVFLAGLILVSVNWMIGHRISPQTMQGRQFLYSVNPQGVLGMRLNFLGQIVARFLKVWSLSFPRDYLHHGGLWLGAPVVLVLTLFLFFGASYLFRQHARRMLLLLSWSLLIVLLYFVVLPSTGHGGRYLSLVLMLFLPVAFLGLYVTLSRLRLSPHHAWLLVSVLVVGTAVWSLRLWRAATAAQIYQIETEHGAMAEWLQQNLSQDVLGNREFAVFDIGRIGYRLHGNVVDLGGLMDPAFLGYVKQDRTGVYLAEHHIRYVVLPSELGNDSSDWRRALRLEDTAALTLVPVHSACVDAYTDSVAENSASTAYACQRAYRLVYSDEPR